MIVCLFPNPNWSLCLLYVDTKGVFAKIKSNVRNKILALKVCIKEKKKNTGAQMFIANGRNGSISIATH